MRVVSLLAGATEMVCALGAGEMLVGRSHECDNPSWVRWLPACSQPAFDISVSSGEIDAEVRRRLHAGGPLYHIDTELIRELQPDLVITQSHCDVCAVTPADLERGGCAIAARQLSLSAATLEGIFESVLQVAAALGLPEQGRVVVAQERQRSQTLRQTTAALRRPTMVMLEWTDPIYAMGNWGPELVEIANGEPLLGRQGEFSTAIPAEQLREADPEYLIVAPCGFDLARAEREHAVLERHPWWRDLRAVRKGNVAFADGNLFFNRSGMTISQSAEIIAEIVHGAEILHGVQTGASAENVLAPSVADIGEPRMKKVLLSWSSGKDSVWALHLLRQQPDVEVTALLTTFNSAADRVAMHAVRRALVETQAGRTGIPMWSAELPWPCSNAEYEERMRGVCQRAIAEGITAVAFGDLFLQDIRDYRVRQLQGTGLEPLFPVWQIPTAQLARDMLTAGVRAKLTCVDPAQVDPSFAGRDYDQALLDALPPGVDPCGENGEFHTFVYDAPVFSRPLDVCMGEIVERDGFVFADVLPK